MAVPFYNFYIKFAWFFKFLSYYYSACYSSFIKNMEEMNIY